MKDPQRDISSGRKTAYYAGLALVIIGFLVFGSVFVSAISGFSSPSSLGQFSNPFASIATRGFIGMALMIGGSFLMRLGSRGVAGSGLLIDPRRTRKDLEPWGRAAGGMLGDALDEAGINPEWERTDQELPFDEKLRRLDQLRKDQLITEEEYQAKRREMMNQSW
jgi:hypothetical protein